MYAYAGNNPVKYIDSDGNESRVSKLFTYDDYLNSDEFNRCLDTVLESEEYNSSPFKVVAYINDDFTTNPNVIWGTAAKKIGKVLFIGGLELFTDYGAYVSIAAYSSGNVILGVTIDALSVDCDISLDICDWTLDMDSKN